MAEGFSEDYDSSDVGDLLEEMSLTDNQAYNPSERWCNTLLETLPNCQPNTSICSDSYRVTTSDSLAGRVVKKLKEQHETTMIENKKKEDKATKAIQEWLLRLPCSFQSLHETCQQPDGCPNMLPVVETPWQRYQLLPRIFNDFKDKWKDYDKAMWKAKSYQEQSGSTWTIKMLERYVTKEDVDFKPSPRSNEEEMKDLSSQHSELTKEIDEKIDLVKFSCDYKFRTECDIRMVLDAILLNVCTFKIDLRIQTE